MQAQLALKLRLRNPASFSNFLAGPNGEVMAALRAWLDDSHGAQLLLWGPQGCGKTHLLEAVCSLSAKANITSAYIPLQDFGANDSEILQGLNEVDRVCIDALDTKLGLPAWELALFQLISERHAGHRPLLLAAREHPRQLPVKLKDLGSRLLWGAAFCLRPLDEAGNLQVLQQAAQRCGVELPTETAQYLLNHYPRDLTSLLALLERLDQASLQQQRRLTVPFLKSILGAGLVS